MSELFREYEPLWNRIKADGTATVIANSRIHSRIIKAVTKEKWQDVGYKLSIDPATAYLSSSTKNAELTFTLITLTRDTPDRRTKRLGVKVLVRNL